MEVVFITGPLPLQVDCVTIRPDGSLITEIEAYRMIVPVFIR